MESGLETGAASPRVVPAIHGRNEATPSVPQTGLGAPTDFPGLDRCPELDCAARLLPPTTIAAARARAAALGVGADRVLIANGHLNEETYLRALGESLGVAFEPLDDVTRARCPVDDDALIESAAAGLLPLSDGDNLAVVVAPRERAARRLVALLQSDPTLARRFRFTTAERLNRFMLRHAGRAIAARATNRLQQTFPMLSAGPRRSSPIPSRLALAGLAMLAGTVIAPTVALHVIAVTLATVFLAWLGLRFAAAFVPAPTPSKMAMPDNALPVYSVVAALYREAASVDGLLRAIERLDYPPEKLDVIVVLEADDQETRDAIAARHCRIPVSVVIAPPGGPRTKPKALNIALALTRGTFTVVYDAEDRPEPNQLRRALQAFVAGGKKLACVQARLCIDNTADSWLARGIMAQTPQDMNPCRP